MHHSDIRWLLRRPLMLAAIIGLLTLGLVMLANSARAAAPAGTTINTNIAADTTWTTAGSPYLVTAPISVNSAATLTIGPGVEVRFATGAGLRIDGGLKARGTQADQIHMIGDGGSAWQGLAVAQPASNVLLQSVTISNAAVGLAVGQPTAALAKAAGRVEVLDSLFTGNVIGVDASSSGQAGWRLGLRNTLLISNGIGMRVTGPSNGNLKLKLDHNSFIANGIALSVVNAGGKGLNAQQQWWGSANGPTVGSPTACNSLPQPGASALNLLCGSADVEPWSEAPAGRAIVPAGQGAEIESAVGQGALSDDDTQPTSVLTLTVPSGAFTQTTDLIATTTTFTSTPPGRPTRLDFEITAVSGNRKIHRFANGRQLRLDIQYLPEDLNGADPSKLVAYALDEATGRWSSAGIRTRSDPAKQHIVVQLEHLTRFRITDVGVNQVFLPTIMQ